MIKYGLMILSLIFTSLAQANNINSAIITKSTLAALPNCLHYQVPTHFCVWINKWGVVNTTPVLSHYLPDLVVSVFAKPHDNPWWEVNKILDNASQPIQKGIVKAVTQIDVGNGNHSLSNSHEQNVIFKEADVIGNPALAIIPAHGLLPSTAKPWRPYFQSMSDSLLWRGLPPVALVEESIALSFNVIHHVGSGITNWGGIFPHEGKVANDNDVKASAVLAARAGDLVTRRHAYAHIYKYLSTSCGKHCTAAPIQENSKETYFQMIYPITEQDCHILGSRDSYSPDMITREGAYVWIVWRHYEGCADGDGQYVGRT